VASATTVLALLIGAPAAYALARLKLPFRLSTVIALSFLVVRFYPKITVALPYYLLMRDLRLLDRETDPGRPVPGRSLRHHQGR